ncbi:hypothetical protein MCEMSEM18_03493 [Comamonadaceae bacterium]
MQAQIPSKAEQWIERSGSLMAWAVARSDRKATYIGKLSVEQTGLKCDCVCPACGGRLQAVNAGKSPEELPPGKSLRPHFRHDAGQQQDACLVKMSQLVALQLLLQEKIIYLPPKTSHWPISGASGHIYNGTAHRDAESMRVRAREWIDEHEAKITLEDGRVVWLRLFGSSGTGQAQNGEAIITIKVDDPEVATWPAEKILEHAQLVGKWLCWEKHWQDSELATQAKEDAEQQAQNWCDFIPEELDLPASLTQAQRSESVLHWIIKGILERAQHLTTPRHSEILTRTMPDKTEERRSVYFEARNYRISNVRLEHRLQGVVSDVICTAQATGEQPMELLVEVAVTHKVDQAKAARIKALGLACVEIDTQRLGKGGRTTVDELRAMVLNETGNKRWIFHPDIEQSHRAAIAHFTTRYEEVAQAIAREKARTSWLMTLNDGDLLQEYLHLLRQVWGNLPPKDRRGAPCWPAELLPTVKQRGFTAMGEAVMTAPRGLLWMVDAIARHQTDRSAVALFEEAITGAGTVRLQSYVSVLGAAITEYKSPMTTAESARWHELREVVKNSVQKGVETYARPTHHDKALCLLFPTLRERIRSQKGTQDAARQIRVNRHIEERQQAARDAVSTRQEEARLLQLEEVAEFMKEVSLFHRWMPAAGWPHDLPTTVSHVQQTLTRRDIAYALPWRQILESAWEARAAGTSLVTWMQSQKPTDLLQAESLLRILEVAWMQERKMLRSQ